MLKTLFSKIVVIFIGILLFSTSFTGVMLYIFLGNFVSQEREYELNESAKAINEYMTYMFENQDPVFSSIYRHFFNSLLKTYSDHTNSVIWIVSTEGEIIYTMGESRLNRDVFEKLWVNGMLALPDERQYKRLMSGNEPFIREIGDFYGLFRETKVSWLTIARPFVYEDIILGVYLHTPIPEVQRARTVVFKFFIISVGVSVVISIILVYVFSLKLSKPLKKINNAAKLIANGEFDKRLDINSNDEIGELVNSFNNMASALENLEEMRKEFIANVSHELRTPMTSISGFIEGILDGTIPKNKEREYLTIVRDETSRLNRLTTDLLDLARMESGETQLNYVDFNINELIRRCVIKMENYIVKKDIQIEANFEEEEIFVNGDVDSIERVIINLLHNAIKFVSQNGKIILSTRRYKNRVLTSVEDNGIGIDQNEIDLIWERFYKSDKSRGERKGTGLGLAIVKNIINEHRQEIWVESEIERGTKFSFTLANGNDEY
ncbi:UNVERIFIED_CONTAM: signal transduction histidine kinase [Acetivibrio alkalicellulosi]